MDPDSQQSIFIENQAFTNVYFIKVDAAGHSNIVRNNTQDRVNTLFDLIEVSIYAAVDNCKRKNDCDYAEFWGWQGDGGLCVIYDKNESVASKTAVSSAFTILDYKLDELRSHLSDLQVKGDLHIRISIHKGSYTYKGDNKRGSIHSKDLNHVAHLEPKTPRDSLTITEDVFRCIDDKIASRFRPLNFPFEENNIFVYKKEYDEQVQLEWLNNITFHNSIKLNTFPERLSMAEKARFLKLSKKEIIDLGTSARTCSFYLEATERPADFSNTIIELIENGVDYTCLLLDPDSEITTLYGELRGEKIKEKTKRSLDRFSIFAEKVKGKRGKFQVLLYSQIPYFAAITIDRNHDIGSMIYSPYMPNYPDMNIERSESPHYMLSKYQNAIIYEQLNKSIDFLIHNKTTKECSF